MGDGRSPREPPRGDEIIPLAGMLKTRAATDGDNPYLLKWTADAGWEISPEELDMHCKAFREGFLVAEVDGEPVGKFF